MNIFVLEDNPQRVEKFKKGLEYHNLFIAKSYNEAEKIFNDKNDFDLMFLDHDLGDNEKTGYDVAVLIVNYKIKYKDAIIHSMNPVGSERMHNLLKGSKIVPFPSLLK